MTEDPLNNPLPPEDVVDVEAKEIAIIPEQIDSSPFLPALSIDQAVGRYRDMKTFVSKCLDIGTDYGMIPGTKKNTLYKPGAEKLTTFFGLRVTFIDDGTIERFDDLNPFFFYKRKCQLWKGDVLIAEASGSANSKESRYHWRWVKEDDLPPGIDKTSLKKRGGKDGLFTWQYEARATTGSYAKSEEYWYGIDTLMAEEKITRYEKQQPWNKEWSEFIEWESFEYRVPNEDIWTLVNTILKMAEKRALVAATLIGCNASDYFTQDMEDIHPGVETESNGKSALPDDATEKQVEEKASDPESIIANAFEMMEAGTFTGNDFLQLGKALEIDSTYVMEVKNDHMSTPEEGGRRVTDFVGAGKVLIEKYQEVNGE